MSKHPLGLIKGGIEAGFAKLEKVLTAEAVKEIEKISPGLAKRNKRATFVSAMGVTSLVVEPFGGRRFPGDFEDREGNRVVKLFGKVEAKYGFGRLPVIKVTWNRTTGKATVKKDW